jgi:hypothetical protein
MSDQCQETVYTRGAYRYSGRGRGGFSMHYERHQCRRFIKAGETHCWQHQPSGGYVSRAEAERIVLDMMTPPDDAAAEPR